MSETLQRGIALARAGKRAEARELLMQVVEADEQNEQAWLWLSGVMDQPEDIRVCLENVLALNPENRQARQGVEWLNARYGVPVAQPTATEVQQLSSEAQEEPLPYSTPVVAVPAPSGAEPVQTAALPTRSLESMAMPESNDEPCPYCGAPTNLSQHNCLRCRKSLMIRDSASETRSTSTSVLGWLHYISGFFIALGGLGFLALAALASQVSNTSATGTTPSLGTPVFFITLAVLVFIGAGFYFFLGRGLMQRARWAYIVAAVFAALGFVGALFQTLGGTVALGAAADSIPAPVRQITTFVILCGFVLQILYVALFFFSYSDFFGTLRRFHVTFKGGDHATHYNNGVAYTDSGMWYMAMREWELAVLRAPNDLNYLHALGLAYAQVRRFDDARTTLDKAIELAPANPQLSESRAIVEQMAKEQR
jgi:tetratricopeptide (TPR) repeat protein